MKCPKCGQSLPEDSIFCQFCGITLDFGANDPIQTHSNTPVEAHEKETQAKESEKNSDKKSPRVFHRVLTIVLALLVIALSVLNYLQYDKIQQHENNIKTLESEKNDITSAKNILADKVAEKDTQIGSLQAEVKELNQVSASYDYLFKYFRNSYHFYNGGGYSSANSLGFSSYNFYVNTAVLSMNKDTKCSIILTAYWPQGGNVSINCSKHSGSIRPVYYNFKEDNWITSVEIVLTAKHPGIQILTFSNDVDDQKFDVIVIVK